MRLGLFACLVAGIASTPGFASEPVYQRLSEAGCATVSTDELGATQLCTGPDGTPFLVSEGDLRISVTFGGVDAGSKPPFQSFGAFNTIGETIEWRVEGGTAVAAILRWLIESPATAAEGQVLVVSKVGSNAPGCVVAYVDALANADANTLAREAADRIAPNVDCASHVPFYYGARGPDAAEPMQ